MHSVRQQKVESMLKREVSNILMTEINDPRVQFVSIHEVSLTKDLKMAHVYISIMGNEQENKKTFKVIRNAEGYIRNRLGKAVVLRYVPKIRFEIDNSQEEKEKILKLLKTIEDEEGSK